jgi:hypothetical protein
MVSSRVNSVDHLKEELAQNLRLAHISIHLRTLYPREREFIGLGRRRMMSFNLKVYVH